MLKFGVPDLVLVDRRYKHSVTVMESQADWTLLYQDNVAQLWGRRDKYNRRDSPNYLMTSHRRISDEKQTGSVTWPAFPQRRESGKLVEKAKQPTVTSTQTKKQNNS